MMTGRALIEPAPRTRLRGTPSEARFPAYAVGCAVVVWALARILFFEGLWPSDSVHHVRFATLWDRIPINHWETRLLFNAALHESIALFGRNELAWALPSLLASLGSLLVSSVTAYRVAGPQAAVAAAAMMAILPIDVSLSTVPIAGSFAVLFCATAMMGLERRSLALTAASVALAILSHPTTIFLMGALGFAIAVTDGTRRWVAAAGVFLGVLGYAIAQGTLFYALTGNPLYEFAVIKVTSPLNDPTTLTFSLHWWLWPVEAFLGTRAFGFTMSLGAVVTVVFWRRLPAFVKGLSLAMAIFWLWIGYGTQSPFEYRPFWRSERFAHSMLPCLAVTVGAAMAHVSSRARWKAAAAALAIPSVAALLVTGTWGQDVEINKLLLPTIKSRPDLTFVADTEARRQLFVLNGCEPLVNVRSPEEAQNLREFAAVQNPISLTEEEMPRVEGTVIASTPVRYRTIAAALPERIVQQLPWLVRRPEGRIVLVRSHPPG